MALKLPVGLVGGGILLGQLGRHVLPRSEWAVGGWVGSPGQDLEGQQGQWPGPEDSWWGTLLGREPT